MGDFVSTEDYGMGVAILSFALVLILISLFIILVSKVSPKKESPNPPIIRCIFNAQERAIMEIEFPRRKQIFEESISLIQSTENIDTLLSRYDVALENCYWFMEQKDKGVPIFFKTDDKGFESALNRLVNFHLIRITESKFNNYKIKMHELKTLKARESNTIKMFEFVEHCLSLLKEHPDTAIYKEELDKIHDQIEDYYANFEK